MCIRDSKHPVGAISNYLFDKDKNSCNGLLMSDEVKLQEETQLSLNSFKVGGFIDQEDSTPETNKIELANHALLLYMFRICLIGFNL